MSSYSYVNDYTKQPFNMIVYPRKPILKFLCISSLSVSSKADLYFIIYWYCFLLLFCCLSLSYLLRHGVKKTLTRQEPFRDFSQSKWWHTSGGLRYCPQLQFFSFRCSILRGIITSCNSSIFMFYSFSSSLLRSWQISEFSFSLQSTLTISHGTEKSII